MSAPVPSGAPDPVIPGAHVAQPNGDGAATPQPTGAPRHRTQTARRLSELVGRQTLDRGHPSRRSTDSTRTTAEP